MVGALLGAGLFCLWWSCWAPDPPAAQRRVTPADRLRDTLAQANVPGVSPAALIATCLGTAAIAFLASPANALTSGAVVPVYGKV